MPATNHVRKHRFIHSFLLLHTNLRCSYLLFFVDGGKVRVSTQKLEWKGKSKVGSLDNVTHKAGGGQVRIFDEKYTGSSSRATSTTRSGSTTPHVDSSTGLQHHQYNADDLLRQTEQKLTLND